jgi:hypothetical protein
MISTGYALEKRETALALLHKAPPVAMRVVAGESPIAQWISDVWNVTYLWGNQTLFYALF